MEEFLDRLREKGIVLTHQRLAILRFLAETKDHPTASEIYEELRKEYPTISQATVYSTLELLRKVGQIRELSIRGDKACFDPGGRPHYHLFCRRCRRVLDVQISCPPLEDASLEGHRVEEVQLYLYGVCADCLDTTEMSLGKSSKKSESGPLKSP
jgi:Fur family peroxide stress response transcriptional regulator